MKKRVKSIQFAYLLSTLVLLAVFTVIVSVIWSSLYRVQLWDSTANYANQMISTANDNFDRILSDVNYNMTTLSFNNEFKRIISNTSYKSNAEMLADRRRMESLLQASTANISSIQDILVVTTSGFSYSRGSTYYNSAKDIKRYFTLTNGRTDTVFVADSGQTDSNTMNLTMIKRINAGLQSESMMIVKINTGALLRAFDQKIDFKFGFILYENKSKHEVYHTPYQQIGLKSSLNIPLVLAAKSNSNYTIQQLGGNEYMVITATSALTDWSTVVLVPQKELTKRYMNTSVINVIFIIMLLLVASVLTCAIASHLTKNIKKLTNAVEQLNGDNWEIRTEIKSEDEVGLLYRKFCEMLDRIQNQMQQIRQDEQEKRKLEIKALQAQINPHFLYNSLSTIKFMAKMKGANNILEATDALSKIMYTNMSKQEYMTFAEEEAYLKSYICLKEYQTAAPINFICELTDTVLQRKVLKLLIQPLVENSLDHGGILEKPDGYISVKIYQEETCITVSVKDNGKGMAPEELQNVLQHLKSNKSIGLFNIMERIRLNYGETFGVTISSEPGIYTLVEMRLPIIE